MPTNRTPISEEAPTAQAMGKLHESSNSKAEGWQPWSEVGKKAGSELQLEEDITS